MNTVSAGVCRWTIECWTEVRPRLHSWMRDHHSRIQEGRHDGREALSGSGQRGRTQQGPAFVQSHGFAPGNRFFGDRRAGGADLRVPGFLRVVHRGGSVLVQGQVRSAGRLQGLPPRDRLLLDHGVRIGDRAGARPCDRRALSRLPLRGQRSSLSLLLRDAADHAGRLRDRHHLRHGLQAAEPLDREAGDVAAARPAARQPARASPPHDRARRDDARARQGACRTHPGEGAD